MDGSQVQSYWEVKEPSQRSLRTWKKFVSNELNFPEQALPARFTGAPEILVPWLMSGQPQSPPSAPGWMCLTPAKGRAQLPNSTMSLDGVWYHQDI